MLKIAANRVALIIAAVVLVLVGADTLVEHHPAFGIDGSPGFGAWYGVLSAGIAIGLASLWGRVARRGNRGPGEGGGDE